MSQVKTYRVLRDGQRVGDSVRDFGDFMPEAEGFDPSALRSLLSAGFLEVTFVDQEILSEWEKNQKRKDKERLSEAAESEDSDSEVTTEDPSDEGGESNKKKKVVKKTAAKKTAKKKVTGNGRRNELAESAV